MPLRNGGVEVSWSLAGVGFACPETPPPDPEAFDALPVSRYPASKFKGARVTLPIDYRVSVADAELGITGTLRWTGKAVLARVGGDPSVSFQWRDGAGPGCDLRTTTSNMTEDETRPGAS